ncbi:MAG: NAD(P)H-binding protein [Deltaproteobacteria bacterium]|jgi:NADH dehydrogenase|nr:NAD(P)H-binding protein [Deltaproteobacteria bacterium]
MTQPSNPAGAQDDAARVLVTGANGQIGLRLIERLARANPRVPVRAAVRSARAARTLEALSEAIRPEICIVDYGDAGQIAEAARGCRHAVHLVGILRETATSRYRDAHEASSRAIADAAAQANLRRIVYLSILESGPQSPNACLASKGRAEQILLNAKTPALILRVPMVIGPGDFTANIVRREALSRVLPLAAGGRSRTQPIYAGDLIEAIVAGLERDDLDDLVLDLAGPESLSQREFIERAAQLYGRRPRFVSLPRGLILFFAGLAERFFANPPITKTALEVILADDDVDPEPARRKLDIELTSLDEILRRCVGPQAPQTE